ncbi:MAG TPA: S-layer family protein [Coleofasciculaceae cyanobacterium]
MDDDARISAETLGDQGNIRLQSESLILRRGSEILTNAQQTSAGGNIAIETQTLTALENSDITANAENANGGRITIRSLGIFGTAFRNATTPDSDITASSALGAEFSGTVQINTPTIDPSAGLLTISENLTDISDRLNQTFCHDVARSGGSFTITGRGGIAATPDTFLDDFGSPAMEPLEPIARSTSPTDRPSIAPESRPETSPIVEANTWQREPDGRLILIAQGNAIAPPGLRLRDCPLPSTSAP